MKKNVSIYWICQTVGWLSYGLTLIFFSYILEKKLSPIFYPRMVVNILIGISTTHLLRLSMLRLHMRPPMPKKQWGKLFVLFILFGVLYSILASSVIEIFKLYEAGNLIPKTGLSKFNLAHIVTDWNGARVTKRFFFSILFDMPILLIWISIYVLWHYIDFTNTEEIKKVKLESIIKELQLKTIKSQINPHFIFNALNSIRALVDEDPQRSRQAITELSNILRSSIQVDKAEFTSLEKELNIVKDYLALEYIRFADRLVVDYDIDEKTLSNQVPPMMFQTLVENAIKHGLSKQPGQCLIKIISKFEIDKHILIVQNTGHLQASEEDGFGLQSTRERLHILYKGQATFEIYQCTSNQVTAKLVLPNLIQKN